MPFFIIQLSIRHFVGFYSLTTFLIIIHNKPFRLKYPNSREKIFALLKNVPHSFRFPIHLPFFLSYHNPNFPIGPDHKRSPINADFAVNLFRRPIHIRSRNRPVSAYLGLVGFSTVGSMRACMQIFN